MRSIQPGEVFELQTERGLAYFQNILKDNEFGYLIRILAGIFKSRPIELDNIVSNKERFFVYFPLGAALNRKLVTFVQKFEIPDKLLAKPKMRRPSGRTKEGKVLNWWVIEGDKEKLVKYLSEDQKKYSIQCIWNDTLLKQRICENWLPEDDI